MNNEQIQDTPIIEELDILAELDKTLAEAKTETPTIDVEIEPGNTTLEIEPDPNPEPEQDEEKEDNTIDASELTDLIIDGGDMAMEYLMPFLYRKSLDPKDVQTMKEIANEYKKAKGKKENVLTFTAEQQRVMEIYIDYEEYTESIPLTTKEKKNLRKPLSKVLSSVDFKASPMNTLIAVVFMIMLPRLLPIIANKISKKL